MYLAGPLVSVVIPVYNRQTLIKRAIESCLNQTYKNIEIVVVDNCSTDNTFNVIQEYTKRDARIRCYRNGSNIGVLENWRKCFNLAKGDYIKMLPSDDWMEPETVEKLVKPFIKGYDIGFSFCSAKLHFIGKKPFVKYQYKEGFFSSKKYILLLLLKQAPLTPAVAIFRKTDVLKYFIAIPNKLPIDCNRLNIGNDLFLYLKVCEKYEYAYYLPSPLIHLVEPTKDEPSITMMFTRKGNRLNLELSHLQAFTYFLRTSSINKITKIIINILLSIRYILTWLKYDILVKSLSIIQT